MVQCTADGGANLGTCTLFSAQLGSPGCISVVTTITNTLLNPVKYKLSASSNSPPPTCLPLDPDSHRYNFYFCDFGYCRCL